MKRDTFHVFHKTGKHAQPMPATDSVAPVELSLWKPRVGSVKMLAIDKKGKSFFEIKSQYIKGNRNDCLQILHT